MSVVFYVGILWYPIQSKILSSFWGIVSYIRNIILLGSTTKKNTTHLAAGCKSLSSKFPFSWAHVSSRGPCNPPLWLQDPQWQVQLLTTLQSNLFSCMLRFTRVRCGYFYDPFLAQCNVCFLFSKACIGLQVDSAVG